MSRATADGVQTLLRYHHVQPTLDTGVPGASETYRWIGLTGLGGDGFANGTVMILSKRSGWISFGDVRVETTASSGMVWCECIGPDDDGDLWFSPITTAGNYRFASVTGKGTSCGNMIAYAWTSQAPSTDGCGGWTAGDEDGTLGAQIDLEVASVGDSFSTNASWTITFSGSPTSGTWELKIDTHSYTLNYNCSASDIDTATGNTTTTGSVGGPFTVTYTSDFSPHDASIENNSLHPTPNHVAFEINNADILNANIPFYCVMFDGGGQEPSLTVAKTVTGDSPTDTMHATFTLTMGSSVIDGTFTATLDGGTPTSAQAYNVADSALASAITGCTVTGTWPDLTVTMSDYLDHTLIVDGSDLVGTTEFRFQQPLVPASGLTCVNSINGIPLTEIPFGDPTHWTGGATPVVLSIDPFSGCMVRMPTEACEAF
jgi:hypothetical protein